MSLWDKQDKSQPMLCTSVPKNNPTFQSQQLWLLFVVASAVLAACLADASAFGYNPPTRTPVKHHTHAMRFESHASQTIACELASTSKIAIGNCNCSRRRWLQGWGQTAVVLAAISTTTVILPIHPAQAVDTVAPTASTLNSIQEATDTLQKLLDNWQKAVIDCTYADVPRELLATENKQELLEKASTFALFDKDVSVVSCKTNNRLVRDYLGVTGKGPLIGLDRKLRLALDEYDIRDVDAFVQAMEDVQQALAKADSFSFSASSDFSALNNFQKEDATKALSGSSNLKDCRACIQAAVEGLHRVTDILRSSSKV